MSFVTKWHTYLQNIIFVGVYLRWHLYKIGKNGQFCLCKLNGFWVLSLKFQKEWQSFVSRNFHFLDLCILRLTMRRKEVVMRLLLLTQYPIMLRKEQGKKGAVCLNKDMYCPTWTPFQIVQFIFLVTSTDRSNILLGRKQVSNYICKTYKFAHFLFAWSFLSENTLPLMCESYYHSFWSKWCDFLCLFSQ